MRILTTTLLLFLTLAGCKGDPKSPENFLWKAPYGCRTTPIVMNGRGTVKDWVPGESRHLHIGNHGGLSEDEMNIPLVVAKR
jgi:hypothetical protein